MASYKIAAVSGSLRKASYNSSLLRAFKEQAPEGVEFEIIDISNLAVYDQDEEVAFPAHVTALKEKLAAADAVVLATPEYNYSMSGAMKNFVDWTSRPYGTGPWKEKPVYTLGATMGQSGTALAQQDLRRGLGYLGAKIIEQPEFYLNTAQNVFGENGVLTDEDTKKLIDAAFVAILAEVDKAR